MGGIELGLSQLKASYIKKIEDCEVFYKKYEINHEHIEVMKSKVEDFKVVVPIVGSFSSGKSSIVNRMLEKNLLSVTITPETAVPTELTYSQVDTIQKNMNGSWQTISLEELKENEFDINSTQLISAKLNNDFLKSIHNVVLVDMPGLDSGIESHNKAIDDYIPNSLAYIITIDSEQGLRESVAEFLKELKLFDMPTFIAITKADKKTKEDMVLFESDIASKVRDILKIENFKIANVSAKEKRVDPIKGFLMEVQTKADGIFEKTYKNKISESISQVEKYISMRIQKKDDSIEEIEEKEKELQRQVDDIFIKVEKEKLNFLDQTNRCIETIGGKIRMNLESMSDSLVSDLMNNSDINSKIISTVRKSITDGIKTEFEPKLQKYFKNISNIVDVNMEIENNVQVDNLQIKMDGYLKEMIIKSIPLIMATIGVSIGGPIGLMIAGVVGIVVEMFFDKKQKEEKRRIAQEKVRGEIIPSVSQKAIESTASVIQDYIEEINKSIEKNITIEKEVKEKALADLRIQKALKKEEQESILTELTNDLEKVRELYAGI